MNEIDEEVRRNGSCYVRELGIEAQVILEKVHLMAEKEAAEEKERAAKYKREQEERVVRIMIVLENAAREFVPEDAKPFVVVDSKERVYVQLPGCAPVLITYNVRNGLLPDGEIHFQHYVVPGVNDTVYPNYYFDENDNQYVVDSMRWPSYDYSGWGNNCYIDLYWALYYAEKAEKKLQQCKEDYIEKLQRIELDVRRMNEDLTQSARLLKEKAEKEANDPEPVDVLAPSDEWPDEIINVGALRTLVRELVNEYMEERD